jgi:hypothetical protein
MELRIIAAIETIDRNMLEIVAGTFVVMEYI